MTDKTDHKQKVATGIYIGSVNTAAELTPRDHIDAIVDLSGVDYVALQPSLHILMDDVMLTPETTKLVIHKFTECVTFIQAQRELGKNVLVHCVAGINRSATCIGMYLISCGWTYDEVIVALTDANTKRGCALLTNTSFRQLLATYAALNNIK